jgi:DNA-directed RNA polymerase subunit RPC12/RpoP
MPFQNKCATCGKTFETPRKYTKYCSNTCRLKALKSEKPQKQPKQQKQPEIDSELGYCLNCGKPFQDNEIAMVYEDDESIEFCVNCFNNHWKNCQKATRNILPEQKPKFVKGYDET